MTSAVLEVVSAGVSDAGLVRDHNEDSFLTARPVFLVSDGLGGHARGELASRAVVDAFAEVAGEEWITSERLLEIVNGAAGRVRALATDGAAPGSTLSGVALTIQGGVPCWLVFNIGDSRTYLLEDGALRQLTVDHSAVRQVGSESVRARNVITRALGAGIDRPPMADQWLIPARAGHRILVCSDGLTGEVSDPLIQASLMSDADPHVVARRLVDAALQAGGRDNVTVVVVDATTVISAPVAQDPGQTLPDITESDDAGEVLRDETIEGIEP